MLDWSMTAIGVEADSDPGPALCSGTLPFLAVHRCAEPAHSAPPSATSSQTSSAKSIRDTLMD